MAEAGAGVIPTAADVGTSAAPSDAGAASGRLASRHWARRPFGSGAVLPTGRLRRPQVRVYARRCQRMTRSARASTVEVAGGWRFGTGWDSHRWALTVRTAFRFADLNEGTFKVRFRGAGFVELWYEDSTTFEEATEFDVTVSGPDGQVRQLHYVVR